MRHNTCDIRHVTSEGVLPHISECECMSSLQHAVPHTLDMWQDSTYPQVYGTACYKEAAGVMAHVKESRDMRTKHVGQFG